METADRKLLTEWLGECWHEVTSNDYIRQGIVWECKKCGDRNYSNRTFDTDTDMMDCMRKLEKEGKWNDFSSWAWGDRPRNDDDIAGFFAWLLCLSDPKEIEERCAMVVEFKPWEVEK